ncbi:MAG: hypothetical protein ABUT20_45480 [Bacteroidota bacterium]
MVKNKILVITGMHCAGTSVVSEWLHACGLPLGDELLEADTIHRNGYFEDIDFLDAHRAILKGRRLPENGFTATPLGRLADNERDRLKDIIFYKNGFNYQWGWKDPRTCLFLDTYQCLVPDAFYFIILRDCRSVVGSMLNHIYRQRERKFASRTGLTRFLWDKVMKKREMNSLCKKYCTQYVKIWIAYNLAILQHLEQLPANRYIVADHDMLYANDRSFFKHITGNWGFALKFKTFTNSYNGMPVNGSFNIDACVKDKSLIGQAGRIEEALRRLSLPIEKVQPLMAV